MTLAEYEKMTDRELDAQVAEKVMGWEPYEGQERTWALPGGEVLGLWIPSIDIADAFEVVEKMRGKSLNLFTLAACMGSQQWSAYVHGGDGWIQANTAPRAICIAALAAVEAAS